MIKVNQANTYERITEIMINVMLWRVLREQITV